jgi:hypothetical protein
MLEHNSLWLSAATAVWPPDLPRTGRWLRWVLAADTRAPLGHVAVTPDRGWPWPAGGRIAAYESPDASLLFTASRSGWFRRRTVVCDADGYRVAWVRGMHVFGRANHLLALKRPAVGGRAGAFMGPQGTEVGTWRQDGAGTVIEFADVIRVKPFAKMGLLAAVLSNA